MKSNATNAKDYLASLPEDRRAAIEAVRNVILKNLDKDYEEQMVWGVLGYVVPHRVFPPGHRTDPKKPLLMAGVSSQKNDMVVYLMNAHLDKSLRAWFRDAYTKTGKRLDMSTQGGCCVRFRKLDDLPLDLVGEAIRRTPVKTYLDTYLNHLAAQGKGPDNKKLKPAKTAKPATKSATKATKKIAKKTAKKAAKKIAKR